MGRLLKKISPMLSDNGVLSCNALGKRLVSVNGINRFLDAGCCDGRLTMEFAEVAKPREVYGVELADEYIAKAESRGIKCVKFDLNCKWPFEDNYFDLILSSQSIEHLHNTRLFLEECYRCLSPGGQLIVLTENLASWPNIFSLLLGWQPFSSTSMNGLDIGNPWTWHRDNPSNLDFKEKYQERGLTGVVGHSKVLSYRGLKEFLHRTGFREVGVYTRGYLPFWGKLSDLLCRIDKRHGHFLIGTGFK